MPRISLRLNGAATGCVALLPGSFAELLAIAQSKLVARQPAHLVPAGATASRVFTAAGVRDMVRSGAARR